jgi:hypothetical protein
VSLDGFLLTLHNNFTAAVIIFIFLWDFDFENLGYYAYFKQAERNLGCKIFNSHCP